jgi:hypothetical protein
MHNNSIRGLEFQERETVLVRRARLNMSAQNFTFTTSFSSLLSEKQYVKSKSAICRYIFLCRFLYVLILCTSHYKLECAINRRQSV